MAFTITGNALITGSLVAYNTESAPTPPPVAITAVAGGTTTVTGQQNVAITSFSPFSSVSNGITPYYYYVSSGTLPAGITINSTTGVVSGTPSAIYSTASVTFSVVDAYSTLATTTYSELYYSRRHNSRCWWNNYSIRRTNFGYN